MAANAGPAASESDSDEDYGTFPSMVNNEWIEEQVTAATSMRELPLGILVPIATSRQARLVRLREREQARRRQQTTAPGPAGAAAGAAGAAASAPKTRFTAGSGLALSQPKSFAGPSARATTFFAGDGAGASGAGRAGMGGDSAGGEERAQARAEAGPAGAGAIFAGDDDTGAGAGAGAGAGGYDDVAEEQLPDSFDPGERGAGASAGGARGPVRELAPTLDLTDIRLFVSTPPAKGLVVQCVIERHKTGTKRMYPTYDMILEEPRTFLLAARKRKKSKSSNYLISLDQHDLARESLSYVGKLRSNFLGTAFTVYDGGQAPGKARAGQEIRTELCAVMYESNILGFKGPRKMTVLTPAIRPNGQPHIWRPDNAASGLLQKFKANERTEMLVLQNKAPVWNEESQSYVLNFNKRVTQASVKNFQIVHAQNPNYILLQFGRTGDNTFTCDFRYPMTALQAFGIVLSSFDSKLACE